RLQAVEYFLGKTKRIGFCLHHERRHRADQSCLDRPAFAMPSQIVRHLAAAGGMTDMDGVAQVEMRRQSRQVVGIMVHIVAVGSLGRATMSTAIVGDDAIAML